MAVELKVNGQTRSADVDPTTPLLWVLRETLGLTGTKFGCGAAQCGACTVHLDGAPTRSCVVPLSAVSGRKVVTIEGLTGRVAEAVQAAWDELQVPQCGYCQSGQVMAATALLSRTPAPSESDISTATRGHLCRCGTYGRIRQAIRSAATRLEKPE